MKRTIILLVILFLVSCNKQTTRLSTPQSHEKPYVILISLDGYRYDYMDRFDPPNMRMRVRNGTKAASLIPCFPSKTFPNHYSIATGMYPERHGIVGNSFYDTEKDGVYKISDREKVRNGAWYSGTPIWVHAEKNGVTSASYFFVGSDADIQGTYPTYYKVYDGKVPNRDRTKQVIEWLKLPKAQRPHLITMYFSDIDSKGHRVGPYNDKALNESIQEIDAILGDFFSELDQLKLLINIVIVSDHGMVTVPMENNIPMEKFLEDENYLTVNNGTYFHVYPKRESMDLDSLGQVFKAKSEHIKVYKTEDAPYYTSNRSNPQTG